MLLASLLAGAWFVSSAFVPTAEGTVVVDTTRVVNVVHPSRAIGGSIDMVSAGTSVKLLSPENVKTMLTTGLETLSMRLNTELGVQAYHWNPSGIWSEPASSGYFTGSATLGRPIAASTVYNLPHRGHTRDQGYQASYSRLTDGDPKTYWKSNPYLSHVFTHEPDSIDPQWVVIDLGKSQAVSTAWIKWVDPYAVEFRVQHWTGPSAMDEPTNGAWVDFPKGVVTKGTGGDMRLTLGDVPTEARYIRLLLIRSSETAGPLAGNDVRNRVGFAIAELGFGTDKDVVDHRADQKQSQTWVSSTDPWHSQHDLFADAEQPGLDLVYKSGLGRGNQIMVPVSVVYGTPEDSANEIAYLKSRQYPLELVEIGEEADQQYMTPEHYGALFIQWAKALHQVDPKLKLGGPVFAAFANVPVWADSTGDTDWMRRFAKFLRSHHAMDELGFVSVEYYPFDPAITSWSILFDQIKTVDAMFKTFEQAKFPRRVPFYVSEYNVSWGSTDAAQNPLGAAFMADFLGMFLSRGGAAAYYYEDFLLPLSGDSGSTFGMFVVGPDGKVRSPGAEFFASKLVTSEWLQSGEKPHHLYPTSCDLKDKSGNPLIGAYAIKRPDGQWSVMLVNRDPKSSHTVSVQIGRKSFSGAVRMASFGIDDYVWHPKGTSSYADPAGPIRVGSKPVSEPSFELAAGSVTVLTGR